VTAVTHKKHVDDLRSMLTAKKSKAVNDFATHQQNVAAAPPMRNLRKELNELIAGLKNVQHSPEISSTNAALPYNADRSDTLTV